MDAPISGSETVHSCIVSYVDLPLTDSGFGSVSIVLLTYARSLVETLSRKNCRIGAEDTTVRKPRILTTVVKNAPQTDSIVCLRTQIIRKLA